ncbi:hypothetical protein RR46_06242 [Papilio xuthus]|uniref:Uncharacterized protein n=1 Tax=Papilio xuthus TaxID=66420 RepID=A0A194QCD7_PAPXU|nr:hypothetical protein RR46_06242 [Papilio xuthus]
MPVSWAPMMMSENFNFKPVFYAFIYAGANLSLDSTIDISFFYRCEISQCEDVNKSMWLEHAIPREKDNLLSKCKQYQFIGNYSQNNGTCSERDFNKAVVEECEKYVYSDEDSAVKDWLGHSLYLSMFNLGLVTWRQISFYLIIPVKFLK